MPLPRAFVLARGKKRRVNRVNKMRRVGHGLEIHTKEEKKKREEKKVKEQITEKKN
jgi:KaiC/GvpD/RAD55 family RecA-like ATPase